VQSLLWNREYDALDNVERKFRRIFSAHNDIEEANKSYEDLRNLFKKHRNSSRSTLLYGLPDWAMDPFYDATFRTLQVVPRDSELERAKRMFDRRGNRELLKRLEEDGKNLRAITRAHDSLRTSVMSIDTTIQDRVTSWNPKRHLNLRWRFMPTVDLRTTAKRELTHYLRDVHRKAGDNAADFAAQWIYWKRLSGNIFPKTERYIEEFKGVEKVQKKIDSLLSVRNPMSDREFQIALRNSDDAAGALTKLNEASRNHHGRGNRRKHTSTSYATSGLST